MLPHFTFILSSVSPVLLAFLPEVEVLCVYVCVCPCEIEGEGERHTERRNQGPDRMRDTER